jgi:hypothetical protein
VRGFASWARFPFAEIEERASTYAVYLMDARYVRRRRVGFGSARVELPKAQLPPAPTGPARPARSGAGAN